jgi:hypothetical protein
MDSEERKKNLKGGGKQFAQVKRVLLKVDSFFQPGLQNVSFTCLLKHVRSN